MVRQAARDWSDDHASSMGAALAYYMIFSLAPLLIIAISIAGMIFGEQAARGELIAQLEGLLGLQPARAVAALLEAAGERPSGTAALGVAILVVGASTVFSELQADIDRIWKAHTRTGSGIWNFLRARLLSVAMVMATGLLLILSLVVSATLSALATYWSGMFGDRTWVLLHALDVGLSLAILMLLFAVIYKVMPPVRIAWRDVWTGAAVTAVLFVAGKVLIGFYIGRSGIASAFGAAGTVVVLLLWIYYSAQIFLLGAEFTKVYTYRRGSRSPAERRSRSRKRSPRMAAA